MKRETDGTGWSKLPISMLSQEGYMTSKVNLLKILSPRAISVICLLLFGGSALADNAEPISYIGHGAFFGADGKQIEVTTDFIEKAHAYYSRRLFGTIAKNKSAALREDEKRISQTPTSSHQNNLLLQNRFLVSIASDSSDPEVGQINAKLNALEIALKHQLPEHALDLAPFARVPTRKFVPDAIVVKTIEKLFLSRQAKGLSSTANQGQKYIDECRSNGVPIPPPMGRLDPNGVAGWKSLGFIPKPSQFIVGTPAEVRVYKSDNPVGMCFALPRYVDDSLQEIELDGAICLGQLSSKMCVWDNQMPTPNGSGEKTAKGFNFLTGEQIPIGVPDLAIDPKGRYQAGGAEIEFGTGGVCTDCHAGENPYVIHPRVDLGNGLLMGRLNKPPLNLPTFSVDRYDPFVGASWPQNRSSMADKFVPDACSQCHAKDGSGGRLPLLSLDLKKGYCGIISLAVERTMPPSKPGSLKDDPTVKAFLARCDSPPDPATADLTP
jgi:hypothetical protein